jgi:hypothetical protein
VGQEGRVQSLSFTKPGAFRQRPIDFGISTSAHLALKPAHGLC